MTRQRVYYLERSPYTGELETVGDQRGDGGFYRPGDLYVLVQPGGKLAQSYDVRVATEEFGVVDDSLDRVGRYRYQLRFSVSKISGMQPMFWVRHVGEYRSRHAWNLIELNADLLDELELNYGYNVLGDTFV